jgi:hypothetical protein
MKQLKKVGILLLFLIIEKILLNLKLMEKTLEEMLAKVNGVIG